MWQEMMKNEPERNKLKDYLSELFNSLICLRHRCQTTDVILSIAKPAYLVVYWPFSLSDYYFIQSFFQLLFFAKLSRALIWHFHIMEHTQMNVGKMIFLAYIIQVIFASAQEVRIPPKIEETLWGKNTERGDKKE